MEDGPLGETASLLDERTDALPTTVALVSHNLWLIPFMGAWNLGRADRCTDGLVAAANELSAQAGGDALVIVAVQEVWAYRAGVFWPGLWLWSKLEASLMRAGWASGRREPLLLVLLKGIFMLIVAVATLIFQSWIPLLRAVLWNPKPRLAVALEKRSSLPYHIDGVAPFRSLPPWTTPVCLMDSGLHLSASRPADASGFVGFCRAGSGEAVALKGMLWARWGALGVINTHMTFEYADGGAQRRKQQAALSALVATLLDAPLPSLPSGAAPTDPACSLECVPRGACSVVLLVGDLNHALPSQCTAGPGP
ncbi:hypothetical protein T484DRAFT_1814870 [Baffinella frigidus]|nr:hypothetical protein T484DRAFT_1814870 [Cryptophyta sp. CCMP2293]